MKLGLLGIFLKTVMGILKTAFLFQDVCNI